MAIVEAVRTPASAEELARSLRRGHVSVFGREPSANRLKTAFTQVAHETGAMKSMWNNNAGNIACTDAWTAGGGNCMDIPGAGGPAAGNPLLFRAYRDLDDGTRDYWDLLGSVRYEDALALFNGGDARAVARALRDAGYFTAPAEEYGGGMARHARDFDPRWAASPGRVSSRSELIADLLLGVGLLGVAHHHARNRRAS